MTAFLSFVAVFLLVAFVILRAYAARSLVHLRRRAKEIVVEEKQAHRAREQVESSLEGLEARISQLKEDHARRRDQLRELVEETERTDAELQRVRGEDEEQAARVRSRKADG